MPEIPALHYSRLRKRDAHGTRRLSTGLSSSSFPACAALRLLQISAQLLQRSSPSPYSYNKKSQQKHERRNHVHVFPSALDVGRHCPEDDEEMKRTSSQYCILRFKVRVPSKVGRTVRPSKRIGSVLRPCAVHESKYKHWQVLPTRRASGSHQACR